MYIISIITSITLLILSYDYNLIDINIALLSDIILYITPQIICLVFWFKTPKFADLIYIRKEMALLNFCVQISLAFYLISIIIFGILINSVYWPIAVGSWIGGFFHCYVTYVKIK